MGATTRLLEHSRPSLLPTRHVSHVTEGQGRARRLRLARKPQTNGLPSPIPPLPLLKLHHLGPERGLPRRHPCYGYWLSPKPSGDLLSGWGTGLHVRSPAALSQRPLWAPPPSARQPMPVSHHPSALPLLSPLAPPNLFPTWPLDGTGADILVFVFPPDTSGSLLFMFAVTL